MGNPAILRSELRKTVVEEGIVDANSFSIDTLFDPVAEAKAHAAAAFESYLIIPGKTRSAQTVRESKKRRS